MENKKLKIVRVTFGLTQEQMAERLDMSRQAYAKIENGQAQGNIKFWARVQKEFNISGEEMWGLINDEAEESAKV